MALVVPNASEITLLDGLRASTVFTTTMKLFKNDYTPDENTILADLVEATFPLYASRSVSTWGSAFTNVAGHAVIEAISETWNRGAGAGSETVYGYYMVNGSGLLLWAERNPGGGVVIDTAGQPFSVKPRFQLWSDA